MEHLTPGSDEDQSHSSEHQEAIQALESMVLDRAAGEAEAAAKQIINQGPSINYGKKEELAIAHQAHAKKLAAVSEIIPLAANEAIAIAGKITEKFERARAFEELTPLAVKTGQVETCLHYFADDDSRYHRDAFMQKVGDYYLKEDRADEGVAMLSRISSVYSRSSALTRILPEHPEQAPAIHAAIMDTSKDAPKGYSSGEDEARCKALAKLAEYVPEAADEAIALVEQIEGYRDTETLLRLAEYKPELGVRAVEIHKAELERNHREISGHERERNAEIQKSISHTAQQLAKAGHPEEATTMVSTMVGYDTRQDTNLALVETALEQGKASEAIEIAKTLNEQKKTKAYIQALPQITEPHLKAEVLELIREQDRKYGRANYITAAALVLPELLPEAEAAIADVRPGFERMDRLIALTPTLVQAGRLPEVIERVKASHYGLEIFRSLESSLPDTLPSALEIAHALNGTNKAVALAELAKYTPDVVPEIIQIFDTAIAPFLQEKMTAYLDHKETYPPSHDALIAMVGQLQEAGYSAEALHLAQGAVSADGYVEATIGLAPEHPEVLPRLIKNLDKLRSTKQFDVSNQLKDLIGKLPDDSLGAVVEGLETSDKPALRLVAGEAMSARLVAAGRVDELLRVLPAELPGYKVFATLSELANSGNVEAIREVINRIDDKVQRLRCLIPLVDRTPELAHDVYQMIEADSNRAEGERRLFYLHDRLLALGAIAPHLPESVDATLAAFEMLITNRNNDSSQPSMNTEAVDQILRNLIVAGRSHEVLEILKSHSYIERRSSTNVTVGLIPTLIEHNETGLALETARSFREPITRALALAQVANGRSEQATGAKLAHLVGVSAAEGVPHAKADRSLNYGYFAADIAKNPLLIEAFMGRATSPAEILAILRAVDIAAADMEAGENLQYQVLKLLQHFDSVATMTEYWKQERLEQAAGVEKADSKRFKYLPNIQQLARNIESNTPDIVKGMLRNGYSVAALCEHPWLINSDTATLPPEGRFPYEGSNVEQQEWLADHAFVQLQGFSRRAIGQILGNRLANNQEYSLHDASQWLQSFQVTNSSDIYNPETDQVESRQLINGGDEMLCLNQLLHGTFTSEELRRLPGFASAGGEITELKTQKFNQLFADPKNTLIYAAVIQALAQSEDGRVDQARVESLIDRWADSGVIQAWAGQGKEIIHGDKLSLAEQAKTQIENILAPDLYDPETKVPAVIGRLRSVGKARKDYIDSTTTWLRTYQNLPGQKLERVWGERPAALADGVADHPSNIHEWSMAAGLRVYFAREAGPDGKLDGEIPVAELLERFRSFVPELVTRYDAERTGEALKRLWYTHTLEADLPAYTMELPDGYTFKVFSKNDPAGLTIGYDTDCCMTPGGASESCIYTGYSDPRFGFVGLYDGQDKLVAQSFVWHNEGVLVLDNIEAQRGRNLEKIQGQYRDALSEYLVRVHREKPELGLQQVNLGTGYLNSQLSNGLPITTAVAMPKTDSHVYSDANIQLQLLEIAPEALQQLAGNEDVLETDVVPSAIEEQPLREARPEIVNITSPAEGAEIISRIEAQVYPTELVIGHADIHEDLQKPKNYSFLIGSRTGNGGVVGYALAYYDETEDGVYVSDLALLPEEQRAGYGVAAMDHLLEQTAEAGEDRIVFDAREVTSYQALKSQSAAVILARHGYQVAGEERIPNHFSNGETVYRVVLERLVAE